MDTAPTLNSSEYSHQHCLPSLQRMGFQFFQEQSFDNGLVSLPAFTGIRISYLYKGVSQNNVTLCAGDLMINSFTCAPMYGQVKDFSMASIGLHFTLLYRLTGITPRECRFPIRLHSTDPKHALLLPLFFSPQEQWEKMVLFILRRNENKLSKVSLRQMERVDIATRAYHSNPYQNFCEIADQMGVSYRQLQRDFSSFLGMSPTEYERADRFRRAVKYLKVVPPAQASIASGYWDQSHMNKEFREITGLTPRQIMQIDDIDVPRLHTSRSLL